MRYLSVVSSADGILFCSIENLGLGMCFLPLLLQLLLLLGSNDDNNNKHLLVEINNIGYENLNEGKQHFHHLNCTSIIAPTMPLFHFYSIFK